MIGHHWDVQKAMKCRVEITRIPKVSKTFHYILCVKKA